MAFLPNGYNFKPASSEGSGSYSYFKPQEGKSKIRIMSEAIVGWEYWTNANKPVRSREYPRVTPDIREETRPKEFWAVVVWNYSVEEVQVWSFTQATIKKSLMAYVEDEDWGDPRGYDLSITKSGTGMETSYTVIPGGQIKPAPDAIKQKVEAEAIDLAKVFFLDEPHQKQQQSTSATKEKPVDLDTIPF